MNRPSIDAFLMSEIFYFLKYEERERLLRLLCKWTDENVFPICTKSVIIQNIKSDEQLSQRIKTVSRIFCKQSLKLINFDEYFYKALIKELVDKLPIWD